MILRAALHNVCGAFAAAGKLDGPPILANLSAIDAESKGERSAVCLLTHINQGAGTFCTMYELYRTIEQKIRMRPRPIRHGVRYRLQTNFEPAP